jgi:hypothetical protein
LDQLQPTDDKTIHLEHFLKPSFVDPVLFAGRSLYLLAANPAARSPFVMAQQNRSIRCQDQLEGMAATILYYVIASATAAT